MDALKIVLLILIPFLLFGLAYYSHYKNRPAWFTRKLIHTFGLLIVGVYGSFINTLEEVIYVIVVFLVILIAFSIIPQIQLFQNLIKMGTRKGERQLVSIVNSTLTSISILSLMIFFFFGDRHLFFAGVLAVSFGDGLGEFVGKPYGNHKYTIVSVKSIEGSVGVLFGTFMGCILAYVSFSIDIFSTQVIFAFFLASLIATIIEALSKSFIDNVTMPWAVAGILWYFG
ncbi:MAG: diacylglycerol/polyprenol kinase family protein [Candidatus Kariarchaeaceae archaeon]